VRDYTYIDAASDSIVVVCVGFESVCKADYHYKDIIGSWPWTNKYVYVKSEPTRLEEEYIYVSLED
jgi:hypothetical protein